MILESTIRINKILLLKILLGIIILTLCAQLKIQLPFSPVPITGQTFGVAFIALSFNRNEGPLTVALYLFLGLSGLPLFAGLHFGPTFGYLIGMLLSSIAIGNLKGKTFKKNLFACYIGSLITLSLGAFWLSFFTPHWFMAGVLPFLPGDTLKNLLAARLGTNHHFGEISL